MRPIRLPAIAVVGLSCALLAGAAHAQAPAYHRVESKDLAWTRKPEAADMTLAYPPAAMSKDRSGAAVLECLLTPKGGVDACVVLAESEPDFGQASLKIARKFGFDASKTPPEILAGAVVVIPISWLTPSAGAPTLDYVAGRPAYLITPAKARGKIACATKAAADQRCDLHALSWERQPELEETASAVRSVNDGPAVTGLLCSVRADRQLDGCEPMGAPTDSQVTAMDQLAAMFTAKAEADDRTPVAEGRVMLRFNWPTLRRAVDASRLSPPPKP
ncbi:hypothetical protein AS593_03370 [Caulobacter vibrioides]|nr:hypothetical protein AS593_03370 [Caulobacter vibrioides]